MSLLEWFFESSNPGPVGDVNINTPDPDDGGPPKKWFVWITVVIGLIVTGGVMYWLFHNFADEGIHYIILKCCYLTLYVVISYFVNFTPDHTNIGWLGGLIDNPFRISDDFNRWLLFAQIILLPGKLIGYSLVMSWLIGRYYYKKLKRNPK